MNPVPTDFLVNLAASLAHDLIRVTTSRLQKETFGDPEQQALGRAYNYAFAFWFEHAAFNLTEEIGLHLADILHRFVSDEQVADQFIALALDEGITVSFDFEKRFRALGFDPSTLPINLSESLGYLVTGLAEGLVREATQSNNPLFNRVNIARLTAVRTILEENKQSWAEVLLILQKLERELRRISSTSTHFYSLDQVITADEQELNQIVIQLSPALQTLIRSIYELNKKVVTSEERGRNISEYLGALRDYCEQLPYVTLPGKSLPLVSSVYIEQCSEELNDGDCQGTEGTDDSQSARHTVTIEQALRRHRHLYIEGGPGTGKSTMLHHLALTLANSWNTENEGEVVPVKVNARKLVAHECSFSESLFKETSVELGKLLQRELPKHLFSSEPKEGLTWLVMIDGLDEIVSPLDRNELIRAIAHQVNRSKSVYRFVVTSRPRLDVAAFQKASFGHYVLRMFEPSQIEAFAHRWFTSRATSGLDDGSIFLAQIEESPIYDLAQVPLLLTMAAIVYELDSLNSLPTSRADLYRRFVTILLEDEECVRETRGSFRNEWDKRYGFEGRRVADKLFSRRLQLLEHLAVSVQTLGIQLFVKAALEFAVNEGWIPQHIDSVWASEQIEILLRRSGLMTWHGADESFIHSTFREYLVASSLANITTPDDSNAQSIVKKWTDDEWREVVLFLFGIWGGEKKDCTHHLLTILESARKESLLFCGIALAEGVKASDAAVDTIIDQLLDSAKRMTLYDLPLEPNPLSVLGMLRGREKVITGLNSLIATRGVAPHVRESAAHVLMRLRCITEANQGWLFLARDSSVIDSVRNGIPKSLGKFRLTDSLYSLASDTSLPVRLRLRAMRQLVELGVTAGLDHILVSIVESDKFGGNIRLQAARELKRIRKAEDMEIIWLYLLVEPRLNTRNRIRVASELLIVGHTDQAMPALLSALTDARVKLATRLMVPTVFIELGRVHDAMKALHTLECDLSLTVDERFAIGKMKKELAESVRRKASPVSSYSVKERAPSAFVALTLRRLNQAKDFNQAWLVFAHDESIAISKRLLVAGALDRKELLAAEWLTIAQNPDIHPEMRLFAAKEITQSSETVNIVDLWFGLIYDKSVDVTTRVNAAEELLKADLLEADAVEVLSFVAADLAESRETRIRAVKILAINDKSEIVLNLVRRLEIDLSLRKEALRIIGQEGDHGLRKTLQRLAKSHPEKDIRRGAQHAIDKIGEREELRRSVGSGRTEVAN